MRSSTKTQLITAVIIVIIVVLVVWYILNPRPQYIKVSTLTRISYQPPTPPSTCSPSCVAPKVCLDGVCGSPLPIFVFTFSQPLPSLSETLATLKSFKLSPDTDPNMASIAKIIIDALLKIPFTPMVLASEIISNSMPALSVSMPLSFTGTGEMWFMIPNK